MELGGTTVEESVGQGAADTLVKEDEHQSNPDAFFGELVGVSGSVTREQGMGFELAQVITELGQGVSFGAELEGGEEGLVDLAGAPSAQLGAAVEQDFHKTEHAGVLDLDAGDFGVARGEEADAGTAGNRREHPGLGPRTGRNGR
jgi:hypothetical protein